MQIRAYLMASGGIEPEALARSAGRFMRGEVAGHNNAFAPSCAEFAEECRFQQMSLAAERRPRLEKPEPKEDTSPRVDPRKLQLLQKALKGHQPSRRKLQKMFPHLDIPDAPQQQEGAAE
ncbi:hypothetical protein EVC14_059 [Rhizobium phage RHph_I3_18]|nr:hypothetical protein EVC14_059 [Rhizobium phage RHph_I3_18]